MVNYNKGDFGRCDCSKNVHMSGDFGNYFGNTEDTSTDLPDYISTAATSQPANIMFYTALLLIGVMVVKKMREA